MTKTIKLIINEEKLRNTIRKQAKSWFPELMNATVLPIEGDTVDSKKYGPIYVNTARYDEYKHELYLRLGGAFYPHGDRDEVEVSVNHGWVKTDNWKEELQKAIKEVEAEVEKTYKKIVSRHNKKDEKTLNESAGEKTIPEPYNNVATACTSDIPDGVYVGKLWCRYFKIEGDDTIYFVDRSQATPRCKENQARAEKHVIKNGYVLPYRIQQTNY